jgi:uncharacterized protein (DUF1501 family)
MNMLNRRRFLQRSAACLALPVVSAFGLESQTPVPGRLIVLFLRGGMDGLFAFSPVSDPRLPELRPTLSQTVLAKGLPLGATGFAAHPSAQVFADLFATKEIAFAPCAGTVDTSRSHFQAQDIFELGNGSAQGRSGFMARAGTALKNGSGAISFTREIPLCFQGGEFTPEIAPLTGSGLKIPEGRALQAIRQAHKGYRTGDALEQAILTEAEIQTAIGMDPTAARGAPGASGLSKTAANMGRILLGNPRLSLAFMDLGGLDTHANEEDSLSRTLTSLGEGIATLKETLGSTEWRRTRIAIMSEFGRTARENGTRGTDHGHGGLFMLAGGSIAGGRMIGEFRGLADPVLNEKRDLPVTADWRALLAACLAETCGIGDAALNIVFPGRPRMPITI